MTTEPAPTVLPRPTRTPAKIKTLPPIQTSSSIWISLPASGPLSPLRIAGSRGCIAPYRHTLGPKRTFSPILMRQVSRTRRLKLRNVLLPTWKLRPWSTDMGPSTNGSVSSKRASSSFGSGFTGGNDRLSPIMLSRRCKSAQAFRSPNNIETSDGMLPVKVNPYLLSPQLDFTSPRDLSCLVELLTRQSTSSSVVLQRLIPGRVELPTEHFLPFFGSSHGLFGYEITE